MKMHLLPTLSLSALMLTACQHFTFHQAGKSAPAPAPTASTASMTGSEALAALRAGNQRYQDEKKDAPQDASDLRTSLKDQQKPFAVILGCADSRVAPEVIFDQDLGKLFVCRVAGNVTDPVVLGSIEYAVSPEHLGVPLIVVLGHSGCGAVTEAVHAAAHPAPAEGNLGALIGQVHIGDNLPSDANAKLRTAVVNNAAYHARQLVEKSSIIRDSVAKKKLRISTGIYHLDSGEVIGLK
ncbi:MAG: carbonic anhydrase [Verrucomicrobiaceae bacterium]|nr:carbonic anhydrase [Verrucomicrobiaceae bacterium]